MFKYKSEQLKDIFNKAFNHSKYNIRLETNNTSDVQVIIDELSKIFQVSSHKVYEHRNKQGYYSYFNVKLMNNNEQETNALLTKINDLEFKINELKRENSELESVKSSLEIDNFMLSRENKALENKLECSKVKNELNAGRKNKFNNEQVNDIIKARCEGKSIRVLAKEFNCSIGLIHKLINEHGK